jgi:hypothetical protein
VAPNRLTLFGILAGDSARVNRRVTSRAALAPQRNARPLDQALQHATTEMVRWLQDGYGLDGLGANLLLGMCVEYEVGNVFDPAYTMVCKMSKATLAQSGS